MSRYACATCHPCGYGLEINSPAGSTVARGDPTTCTTACHHPFGATPQAIPWLTDAINSGAVPCTNCHNNIVPADPVVSAHPGLGGGGVADCTGCHDTSQHGSGTVRLIGFESGGNVCQDCHSGNGGTLLGVTPPLLVGWTGPFGDKHGEPAGNGYGGDLLAPYGRQQPALPCTACHVAHSSSNSFLFAPSVNGSAITAGHIDRAGVGAEELCESCHSGSRHGKCAACHQADPRPAGSACFSCHGHEGSIRFVLPSGSPVDYHDNSQMGGTCDHCHSPWSAPLELVPPVILNGERVIVSAIDGHGATIAWDTDEKASSFVEYGVTSRGFVAGNGTLTPIHSVRLDGLTENTLYSFRVRTVDANRNVTFSSVRSFMTGCASCTAAPLNVANGSFDAEITATTEQVGAWWRDAAEATYCGRFASSEMAGPYVLRISARPIIAWDEELGDEVQYGGFGSASYLFSRAELDAASLVTFDLRPKLLGSMSSVTLSFIAFDSSGAMITDTAGLRNVADVIGYSSPSGPQGLRISNPVVNTTYSRTADVRSTVANTLLPAKSWADVSKVWMVLQATSGASGNGIDVYIDNFR